MAAISERGITVYRKPVLGDMRWNGERWQRWSGRRWAIAAYSLRENRLLDPTPFGTFDEVDDAKRQRALASAVEHQVATTGAYVLYDGPSGAQLAYRRHVPHLMHLFLTLLTSGLWAVVWIAVTLGRGEDRVLLDADAWGDIWARRVPAPEARNVSPGADLRATLARLSLFHHHHSSGLGRRWSWTPREPQSRPPAAAPCQRLKQETRARTP